MFITEQMPSEAICNIVAKQIHFLLPLLLREFARVNEKIVVAKNSIYGSLNLFKDRRKGSSLAAVYCAQIARKTYDIRLGCIDSPYGLLELLLMTTKRA